MQPCCCSQMASFSGIGRRLSYSTAAPTAGKGSQQSLNARREAFLSRMATSSYMPSNAQASQTSTTVASSADAVPEQDVLGVSGSEVDSGGESLSTSLPPPIPHPSSSLARFPRHCLVVGCGHGWRTCLCGNNSWSTRRRFSNVIMGRRLPECQEWLLQLGCCS